MYSKPIFQDSDCLICFLETNEEIVLKNLFEKILIPYSVYSELTRPKSPDIVKKNLQSLINEGFVEIIQIEFGSNEFKTFENISSGKFTSGEIVGRGESAAIALAIEYNGIVASNNLRDVVFFSNHFKVPILTSSMIMAFSLELKLMTKDELEIIWQKILNNTKQKLPKQTFDEYYEELFKKDCVDLLKNYDFKNHYISSKKRKRVKI